MAEQLVGKASDFKDGDRRILFVGDREIGVFKHQGEFYAYSNYCLHQGGPACEGLTIAKVEEHIMPDKTSRGMYFSETEMHFVCSLAEERRGRCRRSAGATRRRRLHRAQTAAWARTAFGGHRDAECGAQGRW
jgi:hypothetical protein